MRYDEELCRRALDVLLKDRSFSTRWTEGPDPPDWFVRIEGRRLAVEVTSIHGFTFLGGKDRSWTGLSKELLSYGNSVCSEVESKINVRGTYLVSFPSFPNLGQWRTTIVRALTMFFQNEACRVERMTPHVVLQSEGRELTVWKVSNEGSALAEQALPTGAFGSHREDQLAGLLEATILKKGRKLEDIEEPAILIILDRYGFQRSIEEWQDRLPAEKSFFQAVVRVQGEKAELVSGRLGNS